MIDQFYLKQEEPQRSCLMAMRDIVLRFDSEITETWKYNMPVFCYRGKMFCYLWIEKKTLQPYLGIVEGRKIDHPLLDAGNRSRMKVMYIDPEQDIPMEAIKEIFTKARTFYQ